MSYPIRLLYTSCIYACPTPFYNIHDPDKQISIIFERKKMAARVTRENFNVYVNPSRRRGNPSIRRGKQAAGKGSNSTKLPRVLSRGYINIFYSFSISFTKLNKTGK